MIHRQATVLVVHDSMDELALSLQVLRNEGYDVLEAENADTCLEIVQRIIPDIFLLNHALPGMDGLALCRELKDDNTLADVPVVFITPTPGPGDIDQLFDGGGADYVAKPVNRTELLARIRTQIRLREALIEVERLRQMPMDVNPITGLPGSNAIAWTLQEAMEQRSAATVIYCDLDDFRAYNKRYGFDAGDRVLKFVAKVLETALHTVCRSEGFLGHFGGDDFVLIVGSNRAETIGNEIVRGFDEGIESYYQKKDRKEGKIMTADRRGRVHLFPFLSLSMAGVPLTHHDFSRYLEVTAACSDAMKVAKATAGSTLFIDRRKRKSDSAKKPV